MLPQAFIKEMEEKLIAEKARLEKELAGLQTHTELGSSQDENAEEVEIDEVNRNLIFRINSDLEKIAKALVKIKAGTYGIDDHGKEIAQDRLRALPWADKAI